jgi:ATP synthase assembly factor FMC1
MRVKQWSERDKKLRPTEFTRGPSSASFRRNTSALDTSLASHPQHSHRHQSPSHVKINNMYSSTPRVRSLYRRLLRELPTHPSASTPASQTTPPRFRSTAHQKLSAPSTVQKRVRESFVNPVSKNEAVQLAQAEQFVQYVQAQRMYATLIERYNPGMGMSEEERVRLTARKVGMELPEEFLRAK